MSEETVLCFAWGQGKRVALAVAKKKRDPKQIPICKSCSNCRPQQPVQPVVFHQGIQAKRIQTKYYKHQLRK